MKVDIGAEQESLKVVNFGDIKGRTHMERETEISNMRALVIAKGGSGLHLVYDKRTHRPQKHVRSNSDLIWPTMVMHCAKVTIINEDGSEEVIKQRAGYAG